MKILPYTSFCPPLSLSSHDWTLIQLLLLILIIFIALNDASTSVLLSLPNLDIIDRSHFAMLSLTYWLNIIPRALAFISIFDKCINKENNLRWDSAFQETLVVSIMWSPGVMKRFLTGCREVQGCLDDPECQWGSILAPSSAPSL